MDCCKKCTRLVSSFIWVRIMSKIASDVALYLKSGANMFVLCMIENPWCRAKGSKFRNCSPFLKKKFRYSPRTMNPLTYYFGFKMSHFCSKTCKEWLFFNCFLKLGVQSAHCRSCACVEFKLHLLAAIPSKNRHLVCLLTKRWYKLTASYSSR